MSIRQHKMKLHVGLKLHNSHVIERRSNINFYIISRPPEACFKARLHRRFLSPQLNAISVAPKLQTAVISL